MADHGPPEWPAAQTQYPACCRSGADDECGRGADSSAARGDAGSDRGTPGWRGIRIHGSSTGRRRSPGCRTLHEPCDATVIARRSRLRRRAPWLAPGGAGAARARRACAPRRGASGATRRRGEELRHGSPSSHAANGDVNAARVRNENPRRAPDLVLDTVNNTTASQRQPKWSSISSQPSDMLPAQTSSPRIQLCVLGARQGCSPNAAARVGRRAWRRAMALWRRAPIAAERARPPRRRRAADVAGTRSRARCERDAAARRMRRRDSRSNAGGPVRVCDAIDDECDRAAARGRDGRRRPECRRQKVTPPPAAGPSSTGGHGLAAGEAPERAEWAGREQRGRGDADASSACRKRRSSPEPCPGCGI